MFSSPVESSKTRTPLCALLASFIADPEPYCAGYHDCKRIPSDCVDEVAVVKGDNREAAYRHMPRRDVAGATSLGVNEIRRHMGQPARCGDSLHVARIPAVPGRAVVTHESP